MNESPFVALRRTWLPPLLGLAAAAVVCAAEPTAVPPGAKPAGPQLTISDRIFDFGTVQQGQVASHTFRLTNTGNAVLEIQDVRPSCGCTTTGDWPHTLQPGQSGELPINVSTEHFAGDVIKSVEIKSNDAAQPEQSIELKATVWTPIKISEPVVIFPAVTDPNAAATRTVTIENEVEGALTLSDARSDNPLFKPVLREVVPGKKFELRISTVPPIPNGTQTGRIQIKSSNAHLPDLTVQAIVTVLPPIQVAPTELMFTAPKLTAAEKRFVVILNHREADLQVSGVSTNAKGVDLTTHLGADKKQFTITLTFPAGFEIHPGDHLYVRGKTNQPSTPTFEVPIVYGGDQ